MIRTSLLSRLLNIQLASEKHVVLNGQWMGSATPANKNPRVSGIDFLRSSSRWSWLLIVQQTEGYFHKYSQFSQATTIPPKPTEDENQTEATIQDLLERVHCAYHPGPRQVKNESWLIHLNPARGTHHPINPPPRIGITPHHLRPEIQQPRPPPRDPPRPSTRAAASQILHRRRPPARQSPLKRTI